MKQLILSLFLLTSLLTACQNPQPAPESENWEKQLVDKLPYLGHRNWIVIADMAYPLQSGTGITTIFAIEPYPAVLAKVKEHIDRAPHVFAHIYRDKELSYITETEVPGIDALRYKMDSICGNESQSVLHEELISRLDKAGRLYNVIIIKTPLSIPYTTTFFELDCAYWTPEQQERLDQAMKQQSDQP